LVPTGQSPINQVEEAQLTLVNLGVRADQSPFYGMRLQHILSMEEWWFFYVSLVKIKGREMVI